MENLEEEVFTEFHLSSFQLAEYLYCCITIRDNHTLHNPSATWPILINTWVKYDSLQSPWGYFNKYNNTTSPPSQISFNAHFVWPFWSDQEGERERGMWECIYYCKGIREKGGVSRKNSQALGSQGVQSVGIGRTEKNPARQIHWKHVKLSLNSLLGWL